VNDFSVFTGFSCGDEDLNDFIWNDAKPHLDELLAVTYAYRLKKDSEVSPPIAFVSLANDSVQVSKSQRKKFRRSKRYDQFPAVKIARLAVDSRIQGNNVGTNILNRVKRLFLTENRTGCRFVTVDAYRSAVRFYLKNDFVPVSQDEWDSDSSEVTMYFNLKRVVL
jgi:GNAT superfamily N-acetyltransferase